MDPLKDLKDIHLPSSVSIWPLAPIWYVIIALTLALIAAIVYLWWRRVKHLRLRKKALKTLETIKALQHPEQQMIQLSELLRRVAMKVYSRSQVAGLKGQAWLGLLDHGVTNKAFSDGPGKLLITFPYQPTLSQANHQQEVKRVIELSASWLLNVTKRGHHV